MSLAWDVIVNTELPVRWTICHVIKLSSPGSTKQRLAANLPDPVVKILKTFDATLPNGSKCINAIICNYQTIFIILLVLLISLESLEKDFINVHLREKNFFISSHRTSQS